MKILACFEPNLLLVFLSTLSKKSGCVSHMNSTSSNISRLNCIDKITFFILLKTKHLLIGKHTVFKHPLYIYILVIHCWQTEILFLSKYIGILNKVSIFICFALIFSILFHARMTKIVFFLGGGYH